VTENKHILKSTFKKHEDILYPLFATIGLVLIWQLSIFAFSIPNYLLPGPYVVMKEIYAQAPLLWGHTLVTLYETSLGFILAIAFAIPISVMVVWWKPVEKVVMPLMIFLQTVPKVSIAPLFIIWFGFGHFPKVLISFLLAYFPIVIEMITGMKDIEPEVVDLSKSMSATPLQVFAKIRIPNSLPYFFTGLKLGGLLSLVDAVIGEFMGSMEGLGYLVIYANDRLNTKLLFADLVVLLLLGKLIYSLIEWIEKYSISWHVVMRDKEKLLIAT